MSSSQYGSIDLTTAQPQQQQEQQLPYRGRVQTESYLEAKVDALMEKYKHVTTMHPALELFTKDKPEYFALFTKVFNHHVRLVKSRPQELERGYITVYDRALVELTAERGRANRGAIALFVEQILGVKKADSVEDVELMLKGNFAVRTALLECVEAYEKKREARKAAAAEQDTERSLPVRRDVFDAEENLQVRGRQQYQQPQPDKGRVERLLHIFNDAEFEYRATDETDAARKKETVKFLRDSAENALAYLQTSQPDHQMIPKLKRTFEMAQANCIWLNGGRKRPFEMSNQEYAKRTRRSNEFKKNARGDYYRPST